MRRKITDKQKVYETEVINDYWNADELIVELQRYLDKYQDVNLSIGTEHHYYSEDTSCLEISYSRLETDEEVEKRVANDKAMRKKRKEEKAAAAAKELEEYERLKKKFDK